MPCAACLIALAHCWWHHNGNLLIWPWAISRSHVHTNFCIDLWPWPMTLTFNPWQAMLFYIHAKDQGQGFKFGSKDRVKTNPWKLIALPFPLMWSRNIKYSKLPTNICENHEHYKMQNWKLTKPLPLVNYITKCKGLYHIRVSLTITWWRMV